MQLLLSHSTQLFSPDEMRNLEAAVCHQTGKTLLELMEQAGTQVAAFILNLCKSIKSNHIAFVCGPGNNGGDGFVAARLLREQGLSCEVVLLESQKYSAELSQQIEIFKRDKIPYSLLLSQGENIFSTSDLRDLLLRCELAVDCLLGTGQKGDPRGLIAQACDCLNQAKAANAALTLVSVDVPTGIDSDQGRIFSPFVVPDHTVVIQHMKRGLTQMPAGQYLGKITVVDAGIKMEDKDPKAAFQLLSPTSELLRWRERKESAHKGDFGHVLVIAGSRDMPGAGTLAAAAALRSGAGLVTQLTSASPSCGRYPEIMYRNFNGDFGPELAAQIATELPRYSSVVLGPGLGKGENVEQFVATLLKSLSQKSVPFVLDADGLNALAKLQYKLSDLALERAVLTPHPAEAARLLNMETSEVQAARFDSVRALSERFQCCSVLKGAGSLCYKSGQGVVNSSGGPYLATGGTGDVLSGMIAAFLAAGNASLEAASLGMYLHGCAGALAYAEHRGPIIASDVIDRIPYAIGSHAQHRS